VLSLQGRVVGITEQRRASELAQIVANLGGTALVAPTIAVEDSVDPAAVRALRRDLAAGAIDTVIFQTGIGVRGLLDAVDEAERPALIADLGRCRIVARGPKPRQALGLVGLRVDVAPAEPTTDGLIAVVRTLDLAGRTVALQQTGDDNAALRAALVDREARVVDYRPYQYRPPPDRAAVQRLILTAIDGGLDALTFTSSPAVRGLFAALAGPDQHAALVRALSARTLVAAVGPTCASTLQAAGVTPTVIPARSTMGAMVMALAQALGPVPGPSSTPALAPVR
jgi:uroporphyrinogen-III synthase